MKMLKIGVFLSILTRTVTRRRELLRLTVFLAAVGGAYLGLVAYETPASQFVRGRLDNLGGPDFGDANFTGAHFITMGVLTLALLMTKRSLLARVLLLAGGALTANGFILTRSRGAFLGAAAAGIAAIVLADRTVRKRLLWLLPVAAVGIWSVADVSFFERIGTITSSEDERDGSAESRLTFWKASLRIAPDYPLGVGADNFFSIIGDYVPEHPGRDPHSTWFRCLVELGFIGIFLLIALFANAFLTLQKCRRMAKRLPNGHDLGCIAFGLQLALVALAVCGTFVTMTYVEELFIFLLLPVCCRRAVDDAAREAEESEDTAGHPDAEGPEDERLPGNAAVAIAGAP